MVVQIVKISPNMSFTILPNFLNNKGLLFPGPKVEMNETNAQFILEEYFANDADGIILNVTNYGKIENYRFEEITYLQVRKALDLKTLNNVFPNVKCLILNEIGKSFLLKDINNFLHLQVLGLLKCKYQINELIPRVRKLSISHQNLNNRPLKYFSSIKELILGSSTTHTEFSGIEYLLDLRYLYYGWARNDSPHLNKLGELPKIQGITLFRASQFIGFPSMGKCFNLKAVCIEECHNVKDLSGLYDASNLDALYVMDCHSIKPELFFPFTEHPTLKHLYWGTNPKDQEKVISKLGNIWSPEMINMEYVLPENTSIS